MKPVVYILCGLPGTGKTTYAKTKLKNITRLSTDEIVFDRHGNYGVDYLKEDYNKYYDPVEEELKQELIKLLKSGSSVVLDYGFWEKKMRDAYKKLIEENNGEWKLFYLKVNKDTLIKRLLERNKRISANSLTVSEKDLDEYISEFEEPVNEGEITIFQSIEK